MVEEIIYRAKRRVVLWKDQNGYLAFADLFLNQIIHELSRYADLPLKDGRAKVMKCWPEGRPCVEAVLRLLRSQSQGGLEGLQGWLWRNGCEWIVVDFREVEPFRRIGGKKAISSMDILSRTGESPSTRSFNELSSVLLGFGDDDGKELRFFAYELLQPTSKRSERNHTTARAEVARRRLARSMAQWLFRAPGMVEQLQKSDREILFGDQSASH